MPVLHLFLVHMSNIHNQFKIYETIKLFNSSEASEPTTSTATTSTSKIVPPSVGDKLKVYYHESKVTYEAKVIEAEGDSYLVHYTGWNTRYDEWVNIDRIAENLSAGTKAKRLKASISGKVNNLILIVLDN